jgi:DNA-binding MarR family transcriptional regulator
VNSELSTILGDLVSVTHRLTRLAAQATGDSTSPATWRTLSVLTSFGPMRLGELAKHSRVSQPTMTKIKRIADSTDARAWQIAIAPKGQRALADWRNRLGDALEPLFDELDPDDVAVLQRTVDLLECSIAVRSEVIAA